MNFFDSIEYFREQRQANRGDIRAQLLQRGRTHHGAGDKRSRVHEGQGHLRRIQPVAPGKLDIFPRCRLRRRAGVALEAGEQAQTRLCRSLPIKVLAGQDAKRQRRVRQQRQLLAVGEFGQAHLEASIEQVVGSLD